MLHGWVSSEPGGTIMIYRNFSRFTVRDEAAIVIQSPRPDKTAGQRTPDIAFSSDPPPWRNRACFIANELQSLGHS